MMGTGRHVNSTNVVIHGIADLDAFRGPPDTPGMHAALSDERYRIITMIAMVPIDIRAASRLIMGIFATGVGFTLLLIAAHRRLFAGEIPVRPTVLLQVMPEAGTTQP